MSGFLVNDENPGGCKLEAILTAIRNEIIRRTTKIMGDERPEATTMVINNIKILNHLAEGISHAENSTSALQKAHGDHSFDVPRIGKA